MIIKLMEDLTCDGAVVLRAGTVVSDTELNNIKALVQEHGAMKDSLNMYLAKEFMNGTIEDIVQENKRLKDRLRAKDKVITMLNNTTDTVSMDELLENIIRDYPEW